ncbi:hypothetical protein [Frateuria soli]|uniref:hypothetical protein n=1 Tax=Frateuria soli TaxID=1542730 RepID=UPI001E62402C|nr:hypothetical protein [Frateuria soli]UGB39566.1 hypothetical protein LQ771_06990 [Frateuria soli]
MTDYTQVWQCIGCGRIEAPQPCIGVCKDRKVFMVGKDEHERVLAGHAALQAQLDCARAMLGRFGLARPREGQWEASWHALQAQVREALAVLAGAPAHRPQESPPAG